MSNLASNQRGINVEEKEMILVKGLFYVYVCCLVLFFTGLN